MPYEKLTDEQVVQYAAQIPDLGHVSDLHDYVKSTRDLVNGADTISIPESHRGLLRGSENHEGSQRLNARIRQLASYFSKGDWRFSIMPSGIGSSVRRGVSAQERFARNGERELGKGTRLHKWKQETSRDLAEIGLSVIQQIPRRGYYTEVAKNPQSMADGARLTDVIFRRRIDPATWGWIEDVEGDIGISSQQGSRHLGAIARQHGIDKAKEMLGYFDFGEAMDPDEPSRWPANAIITTAEVLVSDKWYLVLMGGPNPSNAFNLAGPERIIASGPNPIGRVPVYTCAPGTWPWHSPLDEMIALTNERNYWATMLDLQASGAIFRHWQLVDKNDGDSVVDSATYRNAVPEKLIYDLSKPPPDMGPGTEWTLAPFEFHDVSPRHQQITAQHESAGASVARLIGQNVGSDAAVGTVESMEASAQEEFSEWTEALEDQRQEMWTDYFRWHRDKHRDPVFVFDMKQDPEDGGRFFSITTSLATDDIVSEQIQVTLDTRSRIQKIADFRLAVESITGGFTTYDRQVEAGKIPDVDDAETEKLMIGVENAERVVAEAKIRAIAARAQANFQGPPAEVNPRFLSGNQTDPRGTGTEAGPLNTSDTALATGATDIARAS